MKLLKKIKQHFYLLILVCPMFLQSQVILRLVEAEFSATANVAAYVTAQLGEEAMKTPLSRLRRVSLQEIAYFTVTSEFYNVFLVSATITVLTTLLASVELLNVNTPILFNRRFYKYQARLIHYNIYLQEVSTRTITSNLTTNRGNSVKLTFTILSELHRVSYELGKMLDYLYVRNAVSLLPF